MFLHNHLPNVWVKNVLDSLNELLRAHLNDILDKVAPELRVSPVSMYRARAFDKRFNICAKYPKGLGEVFCQWMMNNNSGELIFHVERTESGGRQDVASMSEIEIFWNREYCAEFLDDMISYCGNSEKYLHAI